jgi:hypothetical protein
MLLVTGRHWKGVRDDTGEFVPEGEIRPDPWVVAEPVATAVEVLENLHDEELVFPNRLGARAETGQRYRDGRSRSTQRMSIDLDAYQDWVNEYCARSGRSDSIPPDLNHPSLQPGGSDARWHGSSRVNPEVLSPRRFSTATSRSR